MEWTVIEKYPILWKCSDVLNFFFYEIFHTNFRKRSRLYADGGKAQLKNFDPKI